MPTISRHSSSKDLLGQPRGLSYLFFAEMFERFSFYGMRAILVLFLVAKIKEGGWGWTGTAAAKLAGMYGFMVYIMCIPGGIIADRYLGMRSATMWGALIQCLGHFSLAFNDKTTFAIGIFLLAVGTGLLKTNISSMVGTLYEHGDKRRDVGFSIFYTGINLGALMSPLVVGIIAKNMDYHAGFTSAGVGMFFSILILFIGNKYFGNTDLKDKPKYAWLIVPSICIIGVIIIFILGTFTTIGFSQIQGGARIIALIIGVSIISTLWYIIAFVLKDKYDKDNTKALIFVLFALFIQCMVFEQASGFYALYTEHFISRKSWIAGLFGWQEIPSSFYQSLNPVFVVMFSWVTANSWIFLKNRFNIKTPAITKIGVGLILLAISCVVLAIAEMQRVQGFMIENGINKASSIFMIAVYWIQTISELCIMPVSLSFVTKVAPKQLRATFMGLLWGVISCGYFMAGEVGSLANSEKYGVYNTSMVLFVGILIIGCLFLLISKRISKLSYDVEND